jgi:hypothetical protein
MGAIAGTGASNAGVGGSAGAPANAGGTTGVGGSVGGQANVGGSVSMQPSPASCPAAASVIHVAVNGNDDATGSSAAPLATLNEASRRAQPGQNVILAAGTYSFGQRQMLESIGTAEKRICFGVAGNVILDGSGFDDHVVNLAGQYLDFVGFDVRNAQRSGIQSWGGKHLRIAHNKVSRSKGGALFLGTITAFDATEDIVVEDNEIFENGSIEQGAAIAASFGAQDIHFLRNHVHHNYGEGIDFILTRRGSAIGNRAHDNYSVNLYLDNASEILVEGNFLYTTGDAEFFRDGGPAAGIQVAAEPQYELTNLPQDNIFINNVIFGGTSFFYGNYGRAPGLVRTTIAHNTFVATHQAWIMFIEGNDKHAGTVVKNNVMMQTTDAVAASIPVTPGISLSHNAWYGNAQGRISGPGDVSRTPCCKGLSLLTRWLQTPHPLALLDAGTSLPSDHIGPSPRQETTRPCG